MPMLANILESHIHTYAAYWDAWRGIGNTNSMSKTDLHPESQTVIRERERERERQFNEREREREKEKATMAQRL
jgi:hypothetical protein